ncbi:MAG: hypothetical protein JO069_21085, partial [Verrucomicrobia bacterium]|nr:hypothetical protein [Verrucomicrobiota bacterium]
LDNPFFGIFWELCLVAAGLHVVGRVRASGPAGRRTAAAFGVLVIGTFLVHSPFAQFYPPPLDACTGQSLNRALVLQIGQAWEGSGDDSHRRPARVQVCFSGPINHDAQQWHAKELRYPLEFGSAIEARNVDAEMRSLAEADFAEVADPASKWLYRWLPSGSFQGELLQRLRADPGFAELPSVAGREGKVYLFRRTNRS